MYDFTFYIVYLIVFRLSIITAGVICVLLGYFLFCRGILGNGAAGNGTTVDASIGTSRFNISNAAPGTLFALFGMVLISTMLFQGSPEMTYEFMEKARQDIAVGHGTGIERELALQLRGDKEGISVIAEWVRKGKEYEKDGKMAKASECYGMAVRTVADPINFLAWSYHRLGEDDKALPLSRLAVELQPDDANSHDTLAEILLQKGDKRDALYHMEQAAKLDQRFQSKLSDYKQNINP